MAERIAALEKQVGDLTESLRLALSQPLAGAFPVTLPTPLPPLWPYGGPPLLPQNSTWKISW